MKLKKKNYQFSDIFIFQFHTQRQSRWI